MKLRHLAGFLAVAATGVGIASAIDAPEGRIGPGNRIQPSGRLLNPVGKLTPLGNLPAGGALTTNGRFLWALSAGRGANDVRIVEVDPPGRCKRGRRGRRCRKRRARRIGRVVQTIPMPGASGGMAMAPDGRTAYVSGTPEAGADCGDPEGSGYQRCIETHLKEQSPKDTPGKDGDVIHVFTYDAARGTATRDGVIEVPPPSGAPVVQSFPPETTKTLSWPRDLAISPDGKTLLAALNLADHAAIVDTTDRKAEPRYVEVGHYPYGAAITGDGKLGLVSNETSGTVSVIDLATAEKVKDIQVGPNLSHPEGIAIDPKRPRAYVAVTHQDMIAVIDTEKLEVERTLSVDRPEGLGTAPVAVGVTRDGCRLMAADSGEDAVAVFALSDEPACERPGRRRARRKRSRRSALAARAERILRREGRRGVDRAESEEEEAAELLGEGAERRAEAAKRRRPIRRRPKAFELIGRVPVASYPVMAAATPGGKKLVWIAAKGVGVGPNTRQSGDPPIPKDSGSSTSLASESFRFKYLPSNVFGRSGVLSFPNDDQLRRLTPKAARQIRPANDQKPPPGTPIAAPGPEQKIEHVFYIVRENRTYDQVLGDDPRGDGDPKLTLFPEKITPNAHVLAKRFPLLDHVYANSEASIDGHFWTSAGAVSDYVVKSWHQNYAGRARPYDFGVYAVTWPAAGFLFDQAEKQGISYFNYGEAIAGVVPHFPDKDRGSRETEQILRKFANSDLGTPATVGGCFPNDASSGGVDVVLSVAPGSADDTEVYDSSVPPGAKPGALSRFDCFESYFNRQVDQGTVPAFNYITLANDHTAGTSPGRRTPNAMVAENDWALGQVVDLISKSSIWKKSLILVIEDDSQDGADHVDAHRIPAFAIGPYAKRGAVVHTRYDFLSFIRTLEILVGMQPLNLFDATAVPMYDAFGSEPSNDEPYEAIVPDVNMTERNTESSPNARFSRSLPLDYTDRTPQRYLDRILWQYVHGPGSEPPPPGPNASGLDEAAWRRAGSRFDPKE